MASPSGLRVQLSRNVHRISRSLARNQLVQIRTNVSTSYEQLTKMRVPRPYAEALKQKRTSEETASSLSHKTASPKQDLPPKRMADSLSRVILPLADDQWLLDKYMNANGDVRLGSIMMDLDALSGVVANKHAGIETMTVTAAIDRVIIRNPLQEIQNLEYSGQVTYATGRSSVEVSLQVAKAMPEGQKPKPEDVLMTCAFTMVSLDPATKEPMSVPALKIETAEEKNLFRLGELNYNAKKQMRDTNLQKTVPNEEEAAMIHNMWIQQIKWTSDVDGAVDKKPDNVAFMDTTRIHTTQIMQPAYRNRHNFMIFGGYLMQQTYELAFTCAAAFSHSRPTFVSLDPSQFKNPVPVGSVLYLTARIAYTEEASAPTEEGYTRVQVRVDGVVRNIEHGEKKPTGQFNYTFLVRKGVKVMPRTYQDFMYWTDARRRAQQIKAFFEANNGTAEGDDGKADRLTE